jgi:hypothetical protein
VVKTKDGKVPSSGRKGRDDQIKGLLRLNRLPEFVTHIVSKYSHFYLSLYVIELY